MNALHTLLPKLLSLLRTRNGLLAIAGLLLLLNAGRLLNGKYAEIVQAVDSKQALLGQYRMSTKDIAAVRARVQQLEARKTQFETHLFRGDSEKEVASAMQIKLQDVLSQAGMNPESISPLTKGGKDDGNLYGEVTIKIRLGGTLDNFIKFMAALYRMEYLFRLENFTVKPFKKEELKIFLELQGYYRLNEPPPQPEDMVKKDAPKKDAAKSEMSKKGNSEKAGSKTP